MLYLLLPHLLCRPEIILLFNLSPLHFLNLNFFLSLFKIFEELVYLEFEFFPIRIYLLRLRLDLLLHFLNGFNIDRTLLIIFEFVCLQMIIIHALDIKVGLTYVTSKWLGGHNAYLNLGMHLWLSRSANLMESLQTSQVIGDVMSSSSSSFSDSSSSFSSNSSSVRYFL